MERIAIVTDSCSDLTGQDAVEHGIEIVPLTLTIEGESMPDGTLSQVEFFRRMNASPTLPTTSQPAIGAFVEVYERALETAQHVISVHISSKLSGTFESTRQAAERFAGRVHVFDTRNLSWGQGLQVLEAARAVSAGIEIDGVIARLERARDRVQLLVGLDSLDNIVKGGRLPRVVGAIGGVLKVKVMITGRDGELHPVKAVRKTTAALEYALSWVEEHMGSAREAAFCVMHALGEDSARRLEATIKERFQPTSIRLVETGTVIATHTGTGWGIAFLPGD